MWFDARKALAAVEPDGPVPATSATLATMPVRSSARVADVADVAAPKPVRRETTPEHDTAALLTLLEREGPQTYGAAAVALGIGATRALAAETTLRRVGRIRLGPFGHANLIKVETGP